MRFNVGAALAMLTVFGAACRRRIESPAPVSFEEEYCWWTALRTTLPVDTVAERYRHAFDVVGLSPVTLGRLADTLWVHAGPTLLTREGVSLSWEGRIVAYRTAGDTTRFRYYVAHDPRARLQTMPSVNLSAQHIGLCGAISKAAQVTSYAPRDPTFEDSLPVWRARR